MHVLGINGWLHDTAAALLRDGQVVFAIEEERWSRDDKHSVAFPQKSIVACLAAAQQTDLRVDHVAFNTNPLAAYSDARRWSDVLTRPSALRRENRRSHHHLRKNWKQNVSLTRRILRKAGLSKRKPRPVFHRVAHHDAHAASAFFVSPFDNACVLTLDGRGEWATTSSYRGEGNRLERLGSIGLPHSLGLFYAAFTEYLGFKRNNDEFKVMGLASYGDPARFRAKMKELLRTTADGFEINLGYFDVGARRVLVGDKLRGFFGEPTRRAESDLDDVHKDLAAALQEITEEMGLHLARRLQARTKARNLCLAGGVALNCVMNQRLIDELPFDDIFVQPAAYDAGGALGAAMWVHHMVLDHERSWVMDRADFGPSYEDEAIESVLKEGLLRYRRCEDVAAETAALLHQGRIVGWFQGRSEFGPRALGHRSILADPSRAEIQDHVNLRVKHREDFRPFAPSCRDDDFRTYFEGTHGDPFMTRIVPVREAYRARLPAITHVDGTARLQTVSKDIDPLYHHLIGELGERSGIPVVLNTSFNVRGEPIVLTPKDALRCFFTTGLDHLAIGSFIVDK